MTVYLIVLAVLAFVTGALFKIGSEAVLDSGVIRMYAWFGVMAMGMVGTGALMRWQQLSGRRQLEQVLTTLPAGFTQLEFGRQAWDMWRQLTLAGGPEADPNFEPPPGCTTDADGEAEEACETCPAAAALRAGDGDAADGQHGGPAGSHAAAESGLPPGWTRERMLAVKTPPPTAVVVAPGGVVVIYTEDIPNHWRGKQAADRLEVAANKAILASAVLGTIVERLFPYRPDCRPIGIYPLVVLTRRQAKESEGVAAVSYLNPEQLPERLAALAELETMHEREREHLVARLAGSTT